MSALHSLRRVAGTPRPVAGGYGCAVRPPPPSASTRTWGREERVGITQVTGEFIYIPRVDT